MSSGPVVKRSITQGQNNVSARAGYFDRLEADEVITTGGSFFGDGTAAEPGIAFEADPDTGLFRDAAGALAVTDDGSAVAAFDAPIAGQARISVGETTSTATELRVGFGTTAATNNITLGGGGGGGDVNSLVIGDLPDASSRLFINGVVAELQVNGTRVVTDQQTGTGGAVGTFAANTSGIADDTATWDGGVGATLYTIGDIVAALKAHGLIAQ